MAIRRCMRTCVGMCMARGPLRVRVRGGRGAAQLLRRGVLRAGAQLAGGLRAALLLRRRRRLRAGGRGAPGVVAGAGRAGAPSETPVRAASAAAWPEAAAESQAFSRASEAASS